VGWLAGLDMPVRCLRGPNGCKPAERNRFARTRDRNAAGLRGAYPRTCGQLRNIEGNKGQSSIEIGSQRPCSIHNCLSGISRGHMPKCIGAIGRAFRPIISTSANRLAAAPRRRPYHATARDRLKPVAICFQRRIATLRNHNFMAAMHSCGTISRSF